MTMSWRFRQYCVKLPLHRKSALPYSEFWYQVENFTYPNMELLRHDDALDTLAMHQAIGKQREHAEADVTAGRDLVEMLRAGEEFGSGIPVMSGLNINDIPNDVLHEMIDRRREDAVTSDQLEWEPWS